MTANNFSHFLRSTTLKLTLTYLGIIALMSISFSFVFYKTSYHQLGRQLPSRTFYQSQMFTDDRFGPVTSFLQNRIDEGRQELLSRLIYLNIFVIAGGGLLSFWLARRTLEPIEEAMESQAQFVSDASHELRTPLTAIKASNEVALRKPRLSIDQAKKIIQQNTEDIAKLQTLTEAMLSLAKNESTQTGLKPTSIQDVLAEAMSVLVQPAQAKNITINDSTSKTEVLADKQNLIQILTILLDNAIKYSGKNTEITVADNIQGKHVYISVTDQGVGISNQDLPHVFDRFFRADRSRTQSANQGYGLGLSIAHKLIQLQNGEITVKSTPGKGSTFTIKLAIAQD